MLAYDCFEAAVERALPTLNALLVTLRAGEAGLTLRLSLEAGHSAALYVEYDSSGCWLPSGSITAPAGGGAFSVTLPVRPRRCDHLRLRLEGTGQLRLFSISRIMEKGSDNT